MVINKLFVIFQFLISQLLNRYWI